MQHSPRPEAIQILEQDTLTAFSSHLAADTSARRAQEFVTDVSGASAAQLQSNLDDPNDWDTAETQRIPPPSTCEETGTFAGAVLVSHTSYSSRKRRNRETQKRQAMSLKHADREEKRKLMAQPEISHAFADDAGCLDSPCIINPSSHQKSVAGHRFGESSRTRSSSSTSRSQSWML